MLNNTIGVNVGKFGFESWLNSKGEKNHNLENLFRNFSMTFLGSFYCIFLCCFLEKSEKPERGFKGVFIDKGLKDEGRRIYYLEKNY
jgi:hypothetical protein